MQIEAKFCPECRETKPVSMFWTNRGKPRPKCIVCMKIAQSIYNKLNREKKYAKNREHVNANREYYREYYKQQYLNNKDHILAKSQKIHSSVEGRSKNLLKSAQRRAIKNGLEFSITYERICYSLLIGACERSGIPFDLNPNGDTFRNPFAPSIDRIDSFKGYTPNNIQVVCNFYNTGKGQHSDEEFIRFCHAVATNNPLR